MKTDSILAEMLDVKEGLGRRFGWDARAICSDLMLKQHEPHPGLPMVEDLAGALAVHARRIAGLPPPPPAQDFLPEDPFVAEVHLIRERLAREAEHRHLTLREQSSADSEE